ncbi:MAG TPA: hypothetical protein VF605_04750 [Allosphingosinicella sp.]
MKKIILASAAALATIGAASAQPPSKELTDITRAAAIADAEQRFRTLDINGNGSLEADELQKASDQRRAERRQRMEQRLAQMSLEERAGFEQRRAERAGGEDGARRGGRERGPGAGRRSEGRPTTVAEFRAQAEQRFDRLDLDRNGVITAAEQAQLRAQRPGRSQ